MVHETNRHHGVNSFFELTDTMERIVDENYSRTSEPNRLHHTSRRQPCGLKALGLQRGIPYEVSRDRRS
jgi:hypothetical protein